MNEAVIDEAVAMMCDRCSGRPFTPTSRTLCGSCLIEVDGAEDEVEVEPEVEEERSWISREMDRCIEEAEAAGAPLPILTGMMNAVLGKGR